MNETEGKKEKYINYVVDDLVKKTEMTGRSVIFPHNPNNPSYLPLHAKSPLYGSSFINHVIDTYGAKKGREIETIYRLYREKIQTLVNV